MAGAGRRGVQVVISAVTALLMVTACSDATSGAASGSSSGASPGTVALPTTVTVSFSYPKGITPAQHELLATAEQAIRAQLHAIYAANPDDPMLRRFWSGRAYGQIRGQVEQWVRTGEVPVGVVVVTRAQVDVDAVPTSRVSYCVSLTRVLRGVTRTHVVGSPVQLPGTAGTRETLTVYRERHGMWRAVDIIDIAESKTCP